MKSVININGTIYTDENEAKISVFDRGFLYGDSVYEVTKTYDGIPFLLEEHLDRLWKSSERLSMPIYFDQNFLINEANKTLQLLDEKTAYIRLVVTRGEGAIGLDPSLADKNNFVIITKKHPENPEWWYEKGVSFIIAGTLRNPVEAMDPNIKSGNYLNNVMAYIEAKKENAYDAMMLNKEGFITEGTTNNIWIVKGGTVITPPLRAGILEGLTRQLVLQLCEKNVVPHKQTDIAVDELFAADECFFTSSTKEIVPITEVNGKKIGNGVPGEMTKRLHRLYKEYLSDYLDARR